MAAGAGAEGFMGLQVGEVWIGQVVECVGTTSWQHQRALAGDTGLERKDPSWRNCGLRRLMLVNRELGACRASDHE